MQADTVLGKLGAITGHNPYVYCSNNGVTRKDTSGHFWDTIFDAASLASSIVEVTATPTNGWAWFGLVGDLVDLVPGVTGVGEIIRGLKTVDNVIETADNVIDTAKALKTLNNAPDALKTATGTYEIIFESGKNYVGKGGFSRAIFSATQHANDYNDIVTKLRWIEAPDIPTAFIWEYILQQQHGVLRKLTDGLTYNIITSPGRKYIK